MIISGGKDFTSDKRPQHVLLRIRTAAAARCLRHRRKGIILQYTKWMELEAKVCAAQDAARYHHTQGVMYTAAALAMAHGTDVDRARLAGLLHDCAKCVAPNREKPALCEKYGIAFTEFERKNPHLLHGKLGAYLAKYEYHVEDEEICSAICYHTTGKPAMTVLEQIIFIADYIEPDRDEQPNLPEIRRTAFRDLDACTLMIMSDTLQYLTEAGRPVDTTTREAYEYYRNLHQP